MLLDPPWPARQIGAVIDAVRSGRITEQRIGESVRRILIMKWNREAIADPSDDAVPVESRVGTAEHLRAAQEIADRTTTLVTDTSHLIPLPPGSVFVTGWGPTQVPQLAEGLRGGNRSVVASVTGENPTPVAIDQATTMAKAHDLVVVTTYRASKDRGQRDLVAGLRATGRPVLVVALGDPYDIAYLEGIDSYLATYSSTSVAVGSAVRVITGTVAAGGRLPVDIGDPADPTVLRYRYGTGS